MTLARSSLRSINDWGCLPFGRRNSVRPARTANRSMPSLSESTRALGTSHSARPRASSPQNASEGL